MAYRRVVLVGLIVALVIARLAVTGASADAPVQAAGWTRPVAGRVVRPFDPPRSRFGAGHLGADLVASRGSAVHAAGPGVVAFAGSVAGALHVVIAHAGNLRTSYSFLATVTVRRGEPVAAGDVVGTTGGTGQGHDGSVLHFALRVGDDYVDPMALFRPVDLATVVHLAPTSIPPRPASEPNERRGLVAGLAHDAGAVAHAAGTALDSTGRIAGAALADGRDALAATGRGIERFAAANFPLQAAAARGVATWWAQRGHCDPHAPAADGTGGSDHRVMIVAGLGSSITNGGPSTALPARMLGYQASEISYFSYAPDGGDYTAADTEASLLDSARLLAAQLRGLERREPGREVDLLAHSQGGAIVQAFLQEIYHPGDPSYPPLGTAVGLSSPLSGDTAATGAARVRSTAPGAAVVDATDSTARALGIPLPPSDAPSVRDLAAGSSFMRGIRSSKLPAQVQFTDIGASTDLIVPGTDASGPGVQSTMVRPHAFNAHSGIVTDPSALRDARAAIEQKPLPCRSLFSTVTDAVVATAISTGERNGASLVATALGGSEPRP